MTINYVFERRGGHTHAVVFCNGNAGTLVLSNEEFDAFRTAVEGEHGDVRIAFKNDDERH